MTKFRTATAHKSNYTWNVIRVRDIDDLPVQMNGSETSYARI